MKLLGVTSFAALVVADPALAQQTNIIPDTGVSAGLGTTVAQNSNVYTIDGGTLSGQNLFHSFQAFDVGAGDVAQWVYSSGSPDSIANVINRVTGGSPTNILGVLDSTAIPNADFYFINPAGIVFSGQGARVNVPAAAYFSTASELRFQSGPAFTVATPSGSSLSVAAPQSFGFLGNEGNILVSDVGSQPFFGPLFLPQNGALSLSAPDITIGNSWVQSNGLALTAVGVASADVPLQGLSAPLAGTILVYGSQIESGNDTNGIGNAARLSAADVLLTNSSLRSTAGNIGDAGPIEINADVLSLSNAFITTYALGDPWLPSFGNGGDIVIRVDDLELTDSWITADSFNQGRGGNIDVQVSGGVRMDGARLVSTSFGTGDGGTVSLSASSADLKGGSFIGSYAHGTGDAGATSVDIAGDLSAQASYVLSESYGTGDGGDVSVSAANIFLSTSQINSNAWSAGLGGDISIVTGLLDIGLFSEVSSNGGDQILDDGIGGIGGNIVISADAVALHGDSLGGWGGSIQTISWGDSAGGSVAINTPILTMSDQAQITATSFGSGLAGSISITADQALLSSGSSITSEALSTGTGGSINLNINSELKLTQSKISSSSGEEGNPTGTVGQAGGITIAAASLTMDDSEIQVDAFDDGDGGVIDIDVAGDINMFVSRISSDAWGDGDGGDIIVNAGGLVDITGLGISSRAGIGPHSTRGPGLGGDVVVTAAALHMETGTIQSNASGEADGGTVTVNISGPMTLTNFSRISSVSLGSGVAGQIHVAAGSADVSDFSLIQSDAFGSGDGGTVDLDILGLLSLDNSIISSSSSADFFGSGIFGGGTGAAGDVTVRSGDLAMTNAAAIQSTAMADGDGGSVTIETGSMSLDFSSIESSARAAGGAGDVVIRATDLDMTTESLIGATTVSSTDAGMVILNVSGPLIMSDSRISTDTMTGRAGAILLNVGSATLNDSEILSRSFQSGDAGLINIEALGSVDLASSFIQTSAAVTGGQNAPGNAGTIFIEAGGLSATDSFIDSEAIGLGNSGSIVITTPGTIELSRTGLSTSAFGYGLAGDIFLGAENLFIGDSSTISSFGAWFAFSGQISMLADNVMVSGGSTISTASYNTHQAGSIDITADQLTLTDPGTEIASENFQIGDAGLIFLFADRINVLDGARVSTNALAGAAGDIFIGMPPTGILLLQGETYPATIQTSSGSGTGGVITIASPLAIISNGGSILALGESGGANVQIDSRYFITSVDRPNEVLVNGTLSFTNSIYDVSSGTTPVDLSMLDASAVLHGQCASVRASGNVSQLNLRPSGPYGPLSRLEVSPNTAENSKTGGCE